MNNFDGKHYINPIPTTVTPKGAMFAILKLYFKKHPNRYPAKTPGPFYADVQTLQHLPQNELRITWLGHSTNIIEINGKRLLTDPVWYKRVSPFSFIGPKRFFDIPIALSDLPTIDYILLSHDHYDHLDIGTILTLTAQGIPVITMKGVDIYLKKKGVNPALITALDWWQKFESGTQLVITAVPTRHFSGRGITNRNTTLWGAFAIKSPEHNVFFGADSGYFNGFKEIGEKLGPFDVTLLEIGAYNKLWPDIHMGPELALKAHKDLKGKYLLPIHWGTFSLAFHTWTEPIERLIQAAVNDGEKAQLVLPSPAQTWRLNMGGIQTAWWKKYQ